MCQRRDGQMRGVLGIFADAKIDRNEYRRGKADRGMAAARSTACCLSRQQVRETFCNTPYRGKPAHDGFTAHYGRYNGRSHENAPKVFTRSGLWRGTSPAIVRLTYSSFPTGLF